MKLDWKLLVILCSAATAFAGEFLPLQSGNQWIYRDLASGHTIRVRVGSPLASQGTIYHRLIGYAGENLWVRARNDGTLVYLDEEAGRERVLTSFEDPGGWSEAPFRGCAQESRTDGPPAPHRGLSGWFPEAQRLEYRALDCTEAEVRGEVFVRGIGMVQRTLSTPAGPRVYELVSARVGKFLFDAAPATQFTATLLETAEGSGLAVWLRLVPGTEEEVVLLYNDSQEYDFVLWDDQGMPIYRWSDGKAFAQSTHTRSISWNTELQHEAVVELNEPLRDGRYVLEAWLTTGPLRRGYAAMTPFRIEGGRLVR